MGLKVRLANVEALFDMMDGIQASNWQKGVVADFRENHPEMDRDLDFCFEVLAGKHKLGYTMEEGDSSRWRDSYDQMCIEEFYNLFITTDRTQYNIMRLWDIIPEEAVEFWCKLCNREYRLGYSNKAKMVTNLSPMLAKKWKDERWRFKNKSPLIFIQEKYDGNRSIWCDGHFFSRRGKEQRLDFDMEEFLGDHEPLIFDGEVITQRGDFNAASGAINSKYGSKDNLVYMIYDIIDPTMTYAMRKLILDEFKDTERVKVAPILAKGQYEADLTDKEIDNYLGKMVEDGGEGIMIRIASGKYENKRSLNLLKYKMVQSMDLKCTGFTYGTGKYEGLLGSLKAELITQDGKHIVTYVGTGLKDHEREQDPQQFVGKILEVEYFEVCKNKEAGEDEYSLRFPRLKGIRTDKTTTSEY